MSWLRAASYERGCPFFLVSATLFTAPGRANRSRQRGIRVAISSEAGLLESERNELADAFLDEQHCAGALALTEHDKASLRAIRDEGTQVKNFQE
jgi:hypothetical protein